MIRGDLLIGWCGMRGLVTLATAFALPADFPGRDLIVLAAFCVVLGTLVLQGLTLKPLCTGCSFDADTSASRRKFRARASPSCRRRSTVWQARTSSSRRSRPQAICSGARGRGKSGSPAGGDEYDELRLRAIKSQRKVLERLRDEGTIGDEAYHRLEEEIDWAELDASPPAASSR